MSSQEGRSDEAERRARRLGFRIAFFLATLGVIVTLPFAPSRRARSSTSTTRPT